MRTVFIIRSGVGSEGGWMRWFASMQSLLPVEQLNILSLYSLMFCEFG